MTSTSCAFLLPIKMRSPWDSTRIAYLGLEAGRSSQLYVAGADGSEAPRRLPGDEEMGLPEEEYYLAPRWSPDGGRLVFISSRPEASGRMGAQDIWTVDVAPPAVAAVDREPAPGGGADPPPAAAGEMRRLTRFTSAAFDPVWTRDGRVVFAVFENYRFTVRQMDLDSLESRPIERHDVAPPAAAEPWAWERHVLADPTRRTPYRRRYRLGWAGVGGLRG